MSKPCKSSSPEMVSSALDGLQRIALGSTNDAVKLACSDLLNAGEMDQLDLFSVAEIRKAKEGFDIKLYNRLEALKVLLAYEQTADSTAANSLLEALNQSASGLNDASVSDAIHEV